MSIGGPSGRMMSRKRSTSSADIAPLSLLLKTKNAERSSPNRALRSRCASMGVRNEPRRFAGGMISALRGVSRSRSTSKLGRM